MANNNLLLILLIAGAIIVAIKEVCTYKINDALIIEGFWHGLILYFLVIISVLIGHFVIQLIFNLFDGQVKREAKETFARDDSKLLGYLNHYRFSSFLLGIIESFVYLLFLFEGKPEFIAGWLVLKGIYKWTEWNRDDNQQTSTLSRAIFNRFLIGTGLNIIISFAIYYLIKSCALLLLSPSSFFYYIC